MKTVCYVSIRTLKMSETLQAETSQSWRRSCLHEGRNDRKWTAAGISTTSSTGTVQIKQTSFQTFLTSSTFSFCRKFTTLNLIIFLFFLILRRSLLLRNQRLRDNVDVLIQMRLQDHKRSDC